MSTKRLIRRSEVSHKTGLCATTIFNLEKQGRFPQHVLITPRCAVWDEEAVDNWITERLAEPAAVGGHQTKDERKRYMAVARKSTNGYN